MSETYVKILQRVDTRENWENNNPILLDKEIGYERETGKYKIGNGIKLWSELPYAQAESKNELENLNYYGNKDIIPSDESYFTVNETGETITGLTDAGKTQTELVIPYEIDGKEITELENGSIISILSGNSVITKVVIPNSVTSIGVHAFYGCSSLTSITIPNSVTSIGDSTFSGCTSLKSINIPNSVTDIGGGTFSNCTSLTSINIPNSVTSIGDGTFNNCTSLTSINIPNSVTSIGVGTFGNCTSLTSINIPNSVTSIEYGAFGNCTSLRSVNIPDSVTWIYFHAFDGCTNLTIYCEQGSYAETYAKENNISVMYTDVYIDKTITENSENAVSGGAVFDAVSEMNNSVNEAVEKAEQAVLISDSSYPLALDAKAIAQSVRADADNGVFNGKDGADYIITEADKEEIKADVVETLTRSSTALPEVLDVNTIYDLGEQDALTLNLPSGKLGDFIEVDFLSTQTPTTLTITASAGMSDYDLIPEANTIYSLYFNWIRLDVETYGWGFGYAEYTRTVTE